MINSHRILLAILGLLFVSSCTPNGDSFLRRLRSNTEFGELSWTGELAADGCGWLLESNETFYALSDLHPDLRINGAKVAMATRSTGASYSCGNDSQADPYPVVEFEWSLRDISVIYYPTTQCNDPWDQLGANSVEDAVVMYLGERGLIPFFVGTLEDDYEGGVCTECSCRSFRYQVLGVATEEVDDYLDLGFVTEAPLLGG